MKKFIIGGFLFEAKSADEALSLAIDSAHADKIDFCDRMGVDVYAIEQGYTFLCEHEWKDSVPTGRIVQAKLPIPPRSLLSDSEKNTEFASLVGLRGPKLTAVPLEALKVSGPP